MEQVTRRVEGVEKVKRRVEERSRSHVSVEEVASSAERAQRCKGGLASHRKTLSSESLSSESPSLQRRGRRGAKEVSLHTVRGCKRGTRKGGKRDNTRHGGESARGQSARKEAAVRKLPRRSSARGRAAKTGVMSKGADVQV